MIKSAKQVLRTYLLNRLDLPRVRHGLPFALWKQLPKEKSLTIVDVGAHSGAFTRAILQISKVRKAVLVEPIPSKAEKLRSEFVPPRFKVYECVLAEKPGTVTLETNDALATSSVLKINRSAAELSQVKLGSPQYLERDARTLDEIALDSRLDFIDLLKLDVQGFEDRVLRGGTETLKMTNLIWTEVSFTPLYEHSCVFHDIDTMLRQSGFCLVEVSPGFRAPNGELLQADVLYRKKAFDSIRHSVCEGSVARVNGSP